MTIEELADIGRAVLADIKESGYACVCESCLYWANPPDMCWLKRTHAEINRLDTGSALAQ